MPRCSMNDNAVRSILARSIFDELEEARGQLLVSLEAPAHVRSASPEGIPLRLLSICLSPSSIESRRRSLKKLGSTVFPDTSTVEQA